MCGPAEKIQTFNNTMQQVSPTFLICPTFPDFIVTEAVLQ